jgi:hypothetical protein
MSQSVMLSPNNFERNNRFSESRQPVTAKIKDIRQAEAFEQLPLQFSVLGKDKYHNSEVCELCERKFTMMFRPHHCRVCAKTCCDKCSLERRLSQEDIQIYFTCNECDFELTNSHLKTLLTNMYDQRDEMMQTVSQNINMADAALIDLKSSVAEKRELY